MHEVEHLGGGACHAALFSGELFFLLLPLCLSEHLCLFP